MMKGTCRGRVGGMVGRDCGSQQGPRLPLAGCLPHRPSKRHGASTAAAAAAPGAAPQSSAG